MVVEQVEEQLKHWLKLAVSLEEELEQPEPDMGVIARLLAERSAVHRRVSRLIEEAAGDESLSRRPELGELAEAILASDRRSMQRADELRAESARKLEELRKRQEMAAGYRRALRGAVADSPTFCDKRI